MRRRDFVILLGGAATGWPLAALAQQPVMPVIGVLHSGARDQFTDVMASFRQGLRETGYVEGQNVTIEYRWADNELARLPGLAAELVQRQVAVIFAAGGAIPPRKAKAATKDIPIVFAFGDDPMRHGLVASWSRPGGNVTGVTTFSGELTAKRFDLLCRLVPNASTIGYIFDPRAVTAEENTNQVLAAASALKRKVIALDVSKDRSLEQAFATLIQNRAEALFVGPYPLFFGNRERVVALAAQNRIPTIYSDRAYAESGGLMSYGASFAGNYRNGAVYVAKILNGAMPADLPVQQANQFELTINLKTAKLLDVNVPRMLLVAATQLIE
jgi:putative tryptophan/tyrosine transport system substrate-binding protein